MFFIFFNGDSARLTPVYAVAAAAPNFKKLRLVSGA
jgi:hypothetical protein